MNPAFDKLNKKIFGGKKTDETPLTGIFDVAREFGNVGDILGREFEVYDETGSLKFKVRQKPIDIIQIKHLIKELSILRKIEIEANKQASKKGKH